MAINLRFLGCITILFFGVLFSNCAKDETVVNKFISPQKESEPLKPETPDAETPKDIVPETILDSIPELPIDSIPEIYFIIDIPSDFGDTSNTDNSIMIHGKEGDLLDYKTFESGDHLVFESTAAVKPDNFTVSILKRDTFTGPSELYFITSYPDIGNRSEWIFKKPDQQPREPQSQLLGGFNVAITHLPEALLRFRLSSHDGGRSLGTYNFENGSYTLHLDNVGVYEKNDFILTVVELDNVKKYLRINDVQPGDDLVFDFSELLNYDHLIEIQLPPNLINQRYFQQGYEEQNEFINGAYGLDEHESGKSNLVNPDVITLGFIDDLPRYRTYIEISTEEYNYSYSKNGTATDNIVLNKPSYSVQNESLFDFEFTTNANYVKRVSSWHTPYDPNLKTIWAIHSPSSNNPKINEFPVALLTAFPNLNLDNLIHYVTSFYVRSSTYTEFIHNSFVTAPNTMDPTYEEEVYTLPKN